MSENQRASAKDVCHWACCQQTRVKGSSLCQSHIDTSLRLGLRIWPGPVDEQPVTDSIPKAR